MICNVSQKKARGSENDQFIGRMARAQTEHRMSEGESQLFDALLNRGVGGRVDRHQSLAERDGDWN